MQKVLNVMWAVGLMETLEIFEELPKPLQNELGGPWGMLWDH